MPSFHRLYRNLAIELGFDVSHLYLRPVPFETANQRSVFVTAALEDGSSVDRHVNLCVIAHNFLICRGSKATGKNEHRELGKPNCVHYYS